MLAGTLLITLLVGTAAALLVFARSHYSPATDQLADAINRILPQTQCAQCGYPGCRPYAEAVATGEAINRCPPGGDAVISALADLLGKAVQPLDESCGEQSLPRVAVIREPECIGCTLCIQACPVDAIIGAPQQMHTVIADSCTGCDLCRPPCPVDCIDLEILAGTHEVALFPAHATACINCGECSTACPRDLQPQLLHWFREDIDRGDTLNLAACIECRRCDNACPSEIALTPTFRAMKARARQRDRDRQAAAAAEARYKSREARLIASTSQVARRPSSNERDRLLDALRGGQ